LVIDDDEHAAGLRGLAQKIWANYQAKINKLPGGGREQALGLPPVDQIGREILNQILDPVRGASPEMRAVLRTKLGLPAETAPAASPTRAPPATTTTPPAAAAGR
jgi:hypothetical protein